MAASRYFRLFPPKRGNLRRTWGNLRRTWGNLRREWGNLRREWGNLRRAWGNLPRAWGNPRRTWGNLRHARGNLRCTARGYESPDGFVVLAGSSARPDDVPNASDFARRTRAALRENGVLASSGAGLQFVQDYEFRSPSGTASVILGGLSINGRTAWKDPAGRTLKELQELA